MTVQVDRYLEALLQTADELEGDIGLEQTRHVLDAHGVRAHVLDLFPAIQPHLQCVHRAHGIRNRALRMLVLLQHRGNGRAKITHVVQRVEDSEDVDSVDGRAFDEPLNHVIGVVTISEYVLPTKQHLLRSARHRRLQSPDPLPRVLSEVANARIEGGAAPGLQRPESHLIEFRGDGKHVVDTKARCKQRLVGVTQNDVGNPKRSR